MEPACARRGALQWNDVSGVYTAEMILIKGTAQHKVNVFREETTVHVILSCENERRAFDALLHPSVLLASSFRRSSGKFDTGMCTALTHYSFQDPKIFRCEKNSPRRSDWSNDVRLPIIPLTHIFCGQVHGVTPTVTADGFHALTDGRLPPCAQLAVKDKENEGKLEGTGISRFCGPLS